jgi:hypothetical protein
MARYKEKSLGLLLPVILSEQLLPGTFEYTLNHLVDNKLDLSIFDGKYNNDLTRAKAIEPGILLKIILYCYSQGIISSRKIAKMCEANIVVKALAENPELKAVEQTFYIQNIDFVKGSSISIPLDVFCDFVV